MEFRDFTIYQTPKYASKELQKLSNEYRERLAAIKTMQEEITEIEKQQQQTNDGSELIGLRDTKLSMQLDYLQAEQEIRDLLAVMLDIEIGDKREYRQEMKNKLAKWDQDIVDKLEKLGFRRNDPNKPKSIYPIQINSHPERQSIYGETLGGTESIEQTKKQNEFQQQQIKKDIQSAKTKLLNV